MFCHGCLIYGRAHDFQNQLCLSLEPPKPFEIIQEGEPVIWKLSILREPEILKMREKRGPNNAEDPFNILLENLNMGSIFIQNHEMHMW